MLLKHTTRCAALLATFGLILAGATACSSGQHNEATSHSSDPEPTGGTLVYATGDAEPTCLDPHVGGNYPQALISSQYIEPLFGRAQDGTILPWLAQQWQLSDDGLTWNITLRDNITFSDGTPFTATAVQRNIEHLQDPATQSSTGYLAVAKIASVEPLTDTTLRIHLSEPDAALLESLSQPWTGMQSPTALARGMKENCAAPVGTGPFTVASWDPAQHITLLRNPQYQSTIPEADHSGPAHLERIEWRFIPDAATRTAALASGEVQVIDSPQPSDIVAAERKGSGTTHLNAPRPGASNRIELNSAHAPFDDIRVREAFIRAADPAPGITSLTFDTVQRSTSLLASTEPFAFSDESLFRSDLTAANTLLDAAGWGTRRADGVRTKHGQPLTVRFPVSTDQSGAAEQALFEQIQANTARAGFQVTLQPVDLSTWYSKLAANEYEAVDAPYTKVGPDVLRILYHSDGTRPAPSGYFANHAQLHDPEIDTLLSAAAAENEASSRAKKYHTAQQLILRSYTVLPLYNQQNHFLTRGVSGVTTLGTVATPTFINARLTAQ